MWSFHFTYRKPLLAPPASSNAAMLEPMMARRVITFFK
jgi:hypothetical protein